MLRQAICALLYLVVLGCASGNRPAQLVSGPGPVYPPAAKAAGIEGGVTVVYDIEVDGRVSNLSVVSSEPEGVFDQAALAAVSRWKFNPRKIDGEPKASRRKQSTVTFKLAGADAYDRY